MSSILVVEQEPRYVERVREALTAEGWQVRVAGDRATALEMSSASVPTLVVVAGEVAGADELLRAFSRRVGGPGVLLLSEHAGALEGFDEELVKPFADQDLRQAVRRLLAARNEAPATTSASAFDARVLTSADIFGDVLAEVEGDAEPVAPPTAVKPPAAPAPAPSPVAPPRPVAAPAPPVATPPAARSAAASADLDRKLEQTLSGMLGPAKGPRAAESRPEVDALLSKTLAGLDMAGKGKPPAPRPAPPVRPPEVVATTQPLPLAPPAPTAAPAPPPAKSPASAASAAAEAPAVAKPPAPTPPATRDELFATQRIEAVRPAALESPVRPVAPPETPKPAPPKPVVAAPPAPPAPVTPAPAPPRVVEVPTPAAPAAAPAAKPTPPAPAAPTPPAEPVVEARAESREFGQYALLERIAIGGMAEVWKARMKGVEGFQKTVAIKRILPHLTDSVDFVTMFIDEAKLAAQLNHNNIIHIYDLGKLGDDYYIAMEYVEGKDLRSILNTGRHNGDPMPLGLALQIAARLASALDYAHRKRDFDNRELGLVHRDVSPQNVLISYEGDIKLCDFGIVKAVAKASKTQMGALKGKLQYMSPEQSWGRSVDARSDIFSLGSVLFEMLTGRRLFAGDSEISVLEAVRDCRIQPPKNLVPSLPDDVNKLVLRAIERDPDDRFQNAGEMQRELERVLYGLKPTPGQAELAVYMQRLFGIESRPAPAPPVTESRPSPKPAAPEKVEKAEKPEKAEKVEKAKPAKVAKPEPPPVAAIAPVTPAADAAAEVVEEKKGRWLPIAAIVALALGGGGYLLLSSKKAAAPGGGEVAGPAPEVVAPSAADTPPTGVTEAPPVAAEGAPAAVATTPSLDPAATEALVAQEVARRQAEITAQEETERKRLEAELARAQQAAASAPAAAPTPAQPAPTPAQTAPAPPPVETAVAPPPPAAAAVREEPAAPTAPIQTAPAAPVVAAPAPAAAAPVAVAAPVALAPEVREGELVQAGPGVISPVLVSQGRTEYPPIAKRMRVQGTVVLQVLVDENGAVAEVKVTKPIAQNVGLNEAAVSAAKTSKYRPATKNGVRVKMWTTLNIPFTL